MELKLFELEVEMRVRRTMRIRAPNQEAAKIQARNFMSLATDPRAGAVLSAVLKWTDGREAYRPMPVETLLLEPEPVFSEPVEIAGE
jgi:hypothetical protein